MGGPGPRLGEPQRTSTLSGRRPSRVPGQRRRVDGPAAPEPPSQLRLSARRTPAAFAGISERRDPGPDEGPSPNVKEGRGELKEGLPRPERPSPGSDLLKSKPSAHILSGRGGAGPDTPKPVQYIGGGGGVKEEDILPRNHGGSSQQPY